MTRQSLTESPSNLENWAYQTLIDGLKSKPQLCSLWTEKFRVLKSGVWTFHRHKYLEDLHDVPDNHIVVVKSAQMGLTETMLNRVFFALDVLREDVLYLFPSSDDAGDFSAGRFNPALEMSPKLQKLFTDVSNIGHKRAGSVNFYCRGSKSRSKLKSIPVAHLYIDEYDEMMQENIPLARERLSGSLNKFEMDISTPTIPDYGIWREWQASNQHRWYARCVHCGHLQHLTIDANITWDEKNSDTAKYFCQKCNRAWTEAERVASIGLGKMIEETSGKLKWGMHISQLYSPTMTAPEMIKAMVEAEEDETKKTEFHNSKLGEPYIAEGAKLTEEDILKCMTTIKYQKISYSATMGIDVSAVGDHYYEISEWENEVKVVVAVGRASWVGLRTLMYDYNIRCCIIDAQPERHMAREFANEFYGKVYLAFYPEGMTKLFKEDDDEMKVKIHRTESLDKTIGMVKTKKTMYAEGIPMFNHYKNHLQATVRILKPDKYGYPVARYISTGPDHFIHASNYNTIAGMLSPVCYSNLSDEISGGSFL